MRKIVQQFPIGAICLTKGEETTVFKTILHIAQTSYYYVIHNTDYREIVNNKEL